MGSKRATVGYDDYCIGGVAKGTHKRPPRGERTYREVVIAAVVPVETTEARLLGDDAVVAMLVEVAGAVEALGAAGDGEFDEAAPEL